MKMGSENYFVTAYAPGLLEAILYGVKNAPRFPYHASFTSPCVYGEVMREKASENMRKKKETIRRHQRRRTRGGSDAA